MSTCTIWGGLPAALAGASKNSKSKFMPFTLPFLPREACTAIQAKSASLINTMPPIQFATPAPTLDDVWRMFQENAQQSKEDHRLMKERIAETDRQMKEHLAETERVMKERSAALSKQPGELGHQLGEFVERMVAPAVVRLFQEQGLEVHEFFPNVTSKRNGEGLEIDLLVVYSGPRI